jgi:universal stress protein E
MIRNILVGLELEPAGSALGGGSEIAVQQALGLATRVGAQITLVHATHAGEHYQRNEDGGVWVVRDGLSTEGRAALEAVVARCGSAGVKADLRLPNSRPWRAICDAALEAEADVVVVGKRSQGSFDFDDRPLGAVALRLLRRCPASVWTVSQSSPEGGLTRVLATTDLGESVGTRIVAMAARLAAAFEAELHVLHVRSRGIEQRIGEALGASQPSLDEVSDDVAARVRAILARIDNAPKPQVTVREGSPTGSIVDTTRQIEPDLLVMGTVARGGLSAALLGNTAERIFRLVDRSLLTIKPADFPHP